MDLLSWRALKPGDVRYVNLKGYGWWPVIVLQRAQFMRLTRGKALRYDLVPFATLGDGKIFSCSQRYLKEIAGAESVELSKELTKLKQRAFDEQNARYATWTYKPKNKYYDYLCKVVAFTKDTLVLAEIGGENETVPKEQWKHVQFVHEAPCWFPAYEDPRPPLPLPKYHSEPIPPSVRKALDEHKRRRAEREERLQRGSR